MSGSIAVIGAGISGLSAACYARMNDYPVTVFEMHKKPGGLCTSWKRGEYRSDACIHWLCGSNARSTLHSQWEEIGALQGKSIVDHEVFTQVESDGRVLTVYTDLDRYEKHLLEISPQDARLIREYTNACRKMAFLDIVPEGTGLFRKIAGILSAILTLLRYARMPQDRFAERFKDAFLRETFLNGFRGLPDCPIIALMFTHALLHNRNAGYPIGGSLEFARGIEKRFLALGGEIRYGAKVEKVLVEDGRAVGLRLADGSEHRYDRVISAADGHATLFGMLGGEHLEPLFREMYAKWEPFPPLVYLSFGVKRDLSGEPHSIDMTFPAPMKVADRLVHGMHVRHFGYDPTLAPPGKSLVIAMFPTSYDHWRGLRDGNPEGYREEKEKVASAVLERLEARFPGFRAAVEMQDVATPTTFERYTGNWRGSFEGWLPTTKTLFKRVPAVLKGLKRFYMIGQWVKPGGGLPPALSSGRDVIRRICKEDGVRFRATRP